MPCKKGAYRLGYVRILNTHYIDTLTEPPRYTNGSCDLPIHDRLSASALL